MSRGFKKGSLAIDEIKMQDFDQYYFEKILRVIDKVVMLDGKKDTFNTDADDASGGTVVTIQYQKTTPKALWHNLKRFLS